MIQSKLNTDACSRHEARENVYERVTIGFTSDWLRNYFRRSSELSWGCFSQYYQPLN